MNSKAITAIRDLAIKYEKTDLDLAYELMSFALQERPSGSFMRKKKIEYEKRLKSRVDNEKKFKKMVSDGELAVIPIGFRCYTKMRVEEKLGITQASLPFDSGFFTPHSVVSLLGNPKVDLNFDSETHRVCIKTEKNVDPVRGLGVKFEVSSYDDIDSLVSDKGMPEIKKYLDSTFGYYTLDLCHNYVLAHYNWHRFSGLSRSKGIYDPNVNLKLINSMMNKRLERMLHLCDKARHVFFIYGETQGYKYMQIDELVYPLGDFAMVEEMLRDIYGQKISIVDVNSIGGAADLIDLLRL